MTCERYHKEYFCQVKNCLTQPIILKINIIIILNSYNYTKKTERPMKINKSKGF